MVENGLAVTVGIHPKHTPVSNHQLKKLEKLLDLTDVAGLGEIGLDHSDKAKGDVWYKQVSFLEKVLPLARKEHVVVFHCRGPWSYVDSIDEQGTLDHLYYHLMMSARLYLKPDQLIHLHCFTGSLVVAQDLQVRQDTTLR